LEQASQLTNTIHIMSQKFSLDRDDIDYETRLEEISNELNKEPCSSIVCLESLPNCIQVAVGIVDKVTYYVVNMFILMWCYVDYIGNGYFFEISTKDSMECEVSWWQVYIYI
jgi:hypothetical protein